MKRNKKIILLCGILLCISLAAFGVSRYEEKKEFIRNSDEIILQVAREDVKALSWECDTGSYAFHRDGESRWLYDADEAFPVDEDKIGGLLEQFGEFGVSFIIEDVEDFGQYGLDTPVCTIHMETESENYEILLGNYSAMDSERYVSIGDGNAYLVKKDPLDQFEIALSDVIRHDEIPWMGEVAQIRISGAQQEQIVYKEGGDASYSCYDGDVYFMQQGGTFMPLDTTRVNSYLSTIKYLNLNAYVTYNASEEELTTYGMDAPELSVELDYITDEEGTDEKIQKTFTLHVGRALEDREKATEEDVTAYARVGESKIIYQITAEQYEKLMDMSYDSLRHQEMFWADFADMYQLDIVLEGENYTITSEMQDGNRIYHYDGKELEMAGIRSTISGLEATDFTDEVPVQKEEIHLTIYLENDNYPEVSIALYRYDGNTCIAVVDGNPVAFVERAKVVALMEAVYAVVLD